MLINLIKKKYWLFMIIYYFLIIMPFITTDSYIILIPVIKYAHT